MNRLIKMLEDSTNAHFKLFFPIHCIDKDFSFQTLLLVCKNLPYKHLFCVFAPLLFN